MPTTPPFDIDLEGDTQVVDVIKNYLDNMFKTLWGLLSPEEAIGTYAHLAERLETIELLLSAAGTGTARVLHCTEAERLALISIPNPSFYITTDQCLVWFYTGTWIKLFDLNHDQTVNGNTTFSNHVVVPTPTIGTHAVNKSYADGLICVAPIELTDWQTNDSEYTVLKINASGSDGIGAGCFYKYVFPSALSTMMRTQTYPLPFGGLNLQFNFSWCGTVAGDGTSFVSWRADVVAIPAGTVVGLILTYANWQTLYNATAAGKKYVCSCSAIPNGSVRAFQSLTGPSMVIPASIYDPGDVLLINFWRVSSNPYSGNAEVGKISLIPAMP